MASLPSFALISRRFHRFLFLYEPGHWSLVSCKNMRRVGPADWGNDAVHRCSDARIMLKPCKIVQNNATIGSRFRRGNSFHMSLSHQLLRCFLRHVLGSKKSIALRARTSIRSIAGRLRSFRALALASTAVVRSPARDSFIRAGFHAPLLCSDAASWVGGHAASRSSPTATLLVAAKLL
jgi:hypothetical protein